MPITVLDEISGRLRYRLLCQYRDGDDDSDA
jgi:hypothetical protein